MLHVAEARDESGAAHCNVLTDDASLARAALVRAVERWFDYAVAPDWNAGAAQLVAPVFTARVR